MKNNKRSLFILKYLTEQTDENHLATIANINEYLRQYDLDANRETISDCIKELQDVGYDIFCVRSTQNQYYMRERPFSLAEVKLLVDAVQSSRFISEEQSLELVSKLADLVGSHKGEILKRHLYIESRAKTDNTGIMEYVDKIHQAITDNRKIKFKYFEYNANKEKVLRYDGYTYTLSPCVLVWNNDMYYVVGVYKDKEGFLYLIYCSKIRCNAFPYRKYFEFTFDLLNFRITSGVCDVLNNPIYSASFCQFCRLLSICFVLTTTANLVFLHSESSYKTKMPRKPTVIT